jgi:hypothetical protein
MRYCLMMVLTYFLESEDLPVLIIYSNLNNTVYWGINTTKPVEKVTVSGNIRVDGQMIPYKGFRL